MIRTRLLATIVAVLFVTVLLGGDLTALAAVTLFARWALRRKRRQDAHVDADTVALFAALAPLAGVDTTRQARQRYRDADGTQRVRTVRVPVDARRHVALERDDTGQVAAVTMRLAPGYPYADTARHDRMTAELAARYGDAWTVQLDPAASTATLRRAAALPERVKYRPLMVGSTGALVFGQGDTGQAVAWDRQAAPHALVVGPTGSGKTVAIRALVTTWARTVGQVVLCDPKRVEYLPFRDRLRVQVVTAHADIEAAVLAARDTMNARYAAVEAGQDPASLPPLLLVVDEAATYVVRARQAHQAAGGRGEPEAVEALHEIARLGRTARVHLLVGLQRPDAAFLSGEARDNYAARLAVGAMGPEGARMMFGDRDATAALDGQVKGRGLYAVNGHRERVQVAYLAADQVPAFLPAAAVQQERAQSAAEGSSPAPPAHHPGPVGNAPRCGWCEGHGGADGLLPTEDGRKVCGGCWTSHQLATDRDTITLDVDGYRAADQAAPPQPTTAPDADRPPAASAPQLPARDDQGEPEPVTALHGRRRMTA